MRRFAVLCVFLPVAALAQTVQVPSPEQGRPGENLPWTRFRPPAAPYRPTAEEIQQIQAKIDQLGAMIRELQAKHVDDSLLVDVEIFEEAGRWNLAFPDEIFRKENVADALSVLDQGLDRASQLKEGQAPWTTQKGRLIRGYRSAVDGSVQPFRLTVPDDYDGSRAFPLDIVQHGRAVGTYEVGFIHDFPARGTIMGGKPSYIPGTIQLEVFGRGNNTYHWPGEADTFEAMAAAEKMYKVDTNRIMLRGFSMGGAGLWHFALHYPDLWSSVEVGAGDNESHRMPVLSTLAPHQQAMCMIFDNMYQWILNAYNMRFIAYVGELDGTFRKHINARLQLAKEGFHFQGESTSGLHVVEIPNMTFFLALNTPHAMAPAYRDRMTALHLEYLKRGREVPDHIRFLTYTTRYNRCFWVTLDGLAKHYVRAEVDATRSPDRTQYTVTTKNLTRLLLRETDRAAVIDIDGQKVSVRGAPEIALEKSGATWRQANVIEAPGLRKRHGMQGPIDDAFLEPFLVVRPTGTPWNEAANREALRILQKFDRQYMVAYRGHIRVKDDTDVTASDLEKYHLVLFGDPGSNSWIAKLEGRTPVAWNKDSITLGARSFPADRSLPAYIYPNPLSPSHYVVVNSGLTADWADWAGDFPTPQYGDFAVLRVDATKDVPDVAYAGLFDEKWMLP